MESVAATVCRFWHPPFDHSIEERDHAKEWGFMGRSRVAGGAVSVRGRQEARAADRGDGRTGRAAWSVPAVHRRGRGARRRGPDSSRTASNPAATDTDRGGGARDHHDRRDGGDGAARSARTRARSARRRAARGAGRPRPLDRARRAQKSAFSVTGLPPIVIEYFRSAPDGFLTSTSWTPTGTCRPLTGVCPTRVPSSHTSIVSVAVTVICDVGVSRGVAVSPGVTPTCFTTASDSARL